uniref:ATP synthase subunit a n=1 Tax=Phascolosoma similis TaxID=2735967 RepID=A0A7D4ZC22_9ANNE|nr:ATP synthase F0 subunit 6 [Phascolosoma similis]QKS32589.1 ATP synthase F0 subunit 6 [Phascolosoma similis]
MLTDIFSSFDPEIYISGRTMYFWLLSISSPLMFFCSFWLSTAPTLRFAFLQLSVMKAQASRTNSLNLPVLHHFLMTLFIFLTSLNLLGLFPYIFSTTSHLMFTLSFGLPLWLMLILSSTFFAPTSFAASLLPAGAPAWLNPFLVLIETISTGVQPGTLSFRLAANMSAGHIVMTLLSIYLMMTFWTTSWNAFCLLLITQISYTMFEGGIALVQAYIFCLLLSLYSDTHPLN